MAGNARAAGASVTSRALSILGAFDPLHPSLTLSDIARRTGIPLATVHRLSGELETWGALRRGYDGRYRIGLRLWELGSLSQALTSAREMALPHLRKLYERTGEDSYLAVPDGSDAVFVEYLGGRRAGTAGPRRRLRHPLTGSAAGLALLAHRGAGASGPRTRLAEVRRRGWALTRDHEVPGLLALAMPVVAVTGTADMAIGLCAPTTDRLARWREELSLTVAAVQRDLACRDSPAPAGPVTEDDGADDFTAGLPGLPESGRGERMAVRLSVRLGG
ncbi:IclR family transcriptional regulator [Streptomyces xinghaiensis]|uniref:IclR family transcriptional regulator n=1 Tax=Streptomyces xinghaiensis TaxID=1038928 RepID=UPI003794FC22